jgi:hypothetical protein
MIENIHGVVTFDQRRTSREKATHERLCRYLREQPLDDIRQASVVFWYAHQPVRMSALRYLAYVAAK